ncbi:MAG: DUF2851 family protein [Opitutales bacterium]|nr:DUF2851 family protein [Opitutales bacterium]
MMENRVAEIQGVYGPVNLAERVLQKIWYSGDFRRDGLKSELGKKIEILKAGEWNHFEGPDFKNAELRIDGKIVFGDVEVHFYASDWRAHHHEHNPAYGNVVLHVVLFPLKAALSASEYNAADEAMETLVLLPYLNRDLEEYAIDDALVAVERRFEEREADSAELLASVAAPKRLQILRERARERWRLKCHFAQKRIAAAGWDSYCHQIVLETLGLKGNRPTMAHLAQRFSPTTMLSMSAKSLFAAEAGNWKLFPLRPPNHPERRLEQYLELLEKNPDWRERLRSTASNFPKLPENSSLTKIFRSQNHLKLIHDRFKDTIFAGVFGGTRFETLMVDAVLPALASESAQDLFDFWFHWFLGDAPASVKKIFAKTGIVSNLTPMSNGLFQGLLQMELDRSRQK